jgi:hypothetical protein
MNHHEDLPYITPAFDGSNPAVFVMLPRFWQNGAHVQSVQLTIAEALDLAAELIEGCETAKDLAR